MGNDVLNFLGCVASVVQIGITLNGICVVGTVLLPIRTLDDVDGFVVAVQEADIALKRS